MIQVNDIQLWDSESHSFPGLSSVLASDRGMVANLKDFLPQDPKSQSNMLPLTKMSRVF